jgi:phosphorylase/glycogen(starch) synthase
MVTVIDVPSYLNGDDGIFNMAYYDLLAGIDAAVFPSYYEPWGYTPLESAAFGVPTITTDLAGFGQWVLDNFGDDSDASGIKVVHRDDSNYGDAVQTVVSGLINLYMMEPKMMQSVRKGARMTSKAASWENFIKYYDEAYQLALENVKA